MKNFNFLFLVIFCLTNCKNNSNNLNIELVNQLDTVMISDQFYRVHLDSIFNLKGENSKEVKDLWHKIDSIDTINLRKVRKIIDKYGWLGADVIGKNGNSALFLVFQHAELEIQEKYLPIIKSAVEKGNANAQDLALLEDRIEMYNNRPQIYGSQMQFENGKYVIYKIIDEKNVNKRRLKVGLDSLEAYVRNYGINYKLPK